MTRVWMLLHTVHGGETHYKLYAENNPPSSEEIYTMLIRWGVSEKEANHSAIALTDGEEPNLSWESVILTTEQIHG